jgi:hypothetical protein
MRGELVRAAVAVCLGAAISIGCRAEPRERPSSPPAAASRLVDTLPEAAGTLPDRVTYAEYVAPILHNSCSRCHRVGEAGRFPLMSYQDAAPRAALIKAVTRARYMPPWPADPTYRHFVDENVLTGEQIALLARWADQGAPRGDPNREPAPPRFPAASQLGKPDLVIRMPTPYHLPGDGKDKFLSMKLPFSIPQDTFVRAIEFVPDNRRLLHHVNAHLVNYADGAKRNLLEGPWFAEAGPGHLDALEELDLRNDDGTEAPLTLSVTNYLPGALPVLYPEGIGGYRMSKQGYLIMHHVHYGPTSVLATDRSKFNVFFDTAPPRRPTYTLLLGTLGRSPVVPPLVIPPNTVQTFRTQFTLPADISVLTINPHMHLLGKTFWAYAVKPGGDTIPLIRIRNWDFRWQYFYTYEKMLHLPAGTTIYAEATYDNTSNNPNNPFNPPQEVREQGGSMRSTDEMFQCIITMLPYQQGDEHISLGNSAWRASRD